MTNPRQKLHISSLPNRGLFSHVLLTLPCITKLDMEIFMFCRTSLIWVQNCVCLWWAGCAVYQNHVQMYLCKGESETEARQSPDPPQFNVSKYIVSLLFVIFVLKIWDECCSNAKTKAKFRELILLHVTLIFLSNSVQLTLKMRVKPRRERKREERDKFMGEIKVLQASSCQLDLRSPLFFVWQTLWHDCLRLLINWEINNTFTRW